MAAAGWQELLDETRALLRDLPVVDGRAEIPDDLRQKLAAKLAPIKDDNNRAVYTVGQLEPEKAGVLARAGIIKWWHAISGAAYFGNAAGMRRLREMSEADPGVEDPQKDYNATLTWASHPHRVTDGVVSRMDRETVAQLFEWGADPGYENGKFFGYVLHQSPADIIRLYLDNGAPAAAAEVALREEMAKKNLLQAQQLTDALGLDGIYSRIDSATLMQVKYIGEATGVASLKTIFNFGARRVNEIYQAPGDAQPVMTSTDFSAYDSGALRRAQETLQKMGGAPPDTLDKPKLSGLRNG
ncbi:MAG TPA: hypothetical protein VEF76_05420 [Patescibacteria group bacterium]|nr:hypothetical protein [Patescibacteria group bacterium]